MSRLSNVGDAAALPGVRFFDFALFEPFDEETAPSNQPTFFIALAGQTTDVILMAGGADKILQSGH